MGLNKKLTISETFLRFHGRVGRLRFLGFNMLIGVLFLPLLLLTVAASSSGPPKGMIAVALAIPYFTCLWCGAALLTKRLHDMNLSGLHGLWIGALWYVPPFVLPDGMASILLQLFAVLVSFWLFLKAGTSGPNRFGLKPGMTVDRTTDGLAGAA